MTRFLINRFLLIIGLMSGVFLPTATTALALEASSQMIGFRGNEAWFQSVNLFGEKTKFDSTTGVGIVSSNREGIIGAEFSLDYMKTNLRTNINEGDLTLIPILFGLQFFLGEKERAVDPYFRVGYGYYYAAFNPSNQVKEAGTAAGLNGFRMKATGQGGFDYGAGLNIKVAQTWMICTEIRLASIHARFEKSWIDGDNRSFVRDNLLIDAPILSIGLKYVFLK